jgi:two-component system, chemotaxis family, protein-glutamate methylesterase/glutaminase
MAQLRVVVVDDSIIFRSVLIECINSSVKARVVAFASNGKEALEKVTQYNPDIITLDIEMPIMNGLQALDRLRKDFPSVPVIMISSSTQESARQTIEALELGALGFIEKPESNDPEQNKHMLKNQINNLIQEVLAKQSPNIVSPIVPTPKLSTPLKVLSPNTPPEIVAIGVSTGGPQALNCIIPRLPGNLCVPIVIVQHMPAIFTASLAESLAQKSKVNVVEGKHGMELTNATVYIAPGGKQMRVIPKIGSPSIYIEITDDPPENFCKPAADYLFRSIAATYKSKALAVILTGMGKDGTQGLKMLKMYGVKVIGQDAATCTVYGMSREAKLAGVVDIELPVESIANEILSSIAFR